MRLRRASATAEEGVFTCHIADDNNTPIARYVGIYYPSELLSECDIIMIREQVIYVAIYKPEFNKVVDAYIYHRSIYRAIHNHMFWRHSIEVVEPACIYIHVLTKP